MSIIVNFDKFKEECSKFDKPVLKMLLWNWAFQRTVRECALVGMFNCCDKDGNLTPKSKVLADYENSMEGERILIGLLGRKEAAKVYGRFEGITSDVKTVDYILNNDSVKHYQELILREKQSKEAKD